MALIDLKQFRCDNGHSLLKQGLQLKFLYINSPPSSGIRGGVYIGDDELFEYALKEYERLQQEALPLRGQDVSSYKKTFKTSTQAMPDNCKTDYSIKIYNRQPSKSVDETDIELAN